MYLDLTYFHSLLLLTAGVLKGPKNHPDMAVGKLEKAVVVI